jgi:hypothetical protein
MKKNILAALILFQQFSWAGESLGLNLDIKSHETYKVDENRIEGQSTVLTSQITFIGTNSAGEPFNLLLPPMPEKKSIDIVLEVLSENSVRMTSLKDQIINVVFAAEIQRDSKGQISGLKVSSETMTGLFSNALKQNGMQLVTKYNLNKPGIEFKYETKIAGFNCSVADAIATCDSKMSLKILALEVPL